MLRRPPAGFPVYGLDSPFPGPRWLELFGDPPDGSPTWVSLNHLSADGRSLVNVTTHVHRATGNPRSYSVPTDEQAAQSGRSPLMSVAGQCAVRLVNQTLPVRPLTRPPGFLRALADLSTEAANAYSAWAFTRWQVDLREPLSFEVVNAAAGAAGVPVGSDPPWERQDWHPDQLQLMRKLGQEPN